MKIEDKLTETRRSVEVKAGQTRATQDMELIVLIIKAPIAINTEMKEGFSAVILRNGNDGAFEFELDSEYHVESAETILELFPVLIDSTLTLKEFTR